MRILHLYANWKWTGPAEPAVNLAAGQRRQGHEVLFVPGRAVKGLDNLIARHARERGLDVREAPCARASCTPLESPAALQQGADRNTANRATAALIHDMFGVWPVV